MTGARVLRVVAATVVLGLTVAVSAPAGAVAPARVNGAGSSYVALAIQQWVADAQTRGLPVNYLPTSSPDGLTQYADGLLDFGATEAEYSALVGSNVGGPADNRGYQYVPDVAGATGVMYHVQDKAGRKVDYLHLSMKTIARIFMGDITSWADPTITIDNRGLVLPDKPINVVYRSGLSGTTGSFYDFVAHAYPSLFAQWAAKYHLPTSVRIIQLDGVQNFAPHTQAFGSSDQVVQFISSGDGMWSIGYDEFGYALVYGADTAWVQNASGHWVKPYAENISAALERAQLRPDLSQELSGVYASQNPLAYPISSYSYLVVQCANVPNTTNRPTCKGKYPNPGVVETLARWMKYIECDGQVNMARIGYSPLPPNLSQEIENSISRLQGTPPVQLTPANCSNPRFHGSLGQGSSSPPDPLAHIPEIVVVPGNNPGSTTPGATSPGQSPGGTNGSASGNPNSNANGSSGTKNPSGACPTTTTTTTKPKSTTTKPKSTSTTTTTIACTPSARRSTNGAGVLGGEAAAAGGGTDELRAVKPVAYNRPGTPAPSNWPAWALAFAVALPPAIAGTRRVWRRRTGGV